MSTLEEFGPYVLLKKLSEDSLGEAFRAGRVGGEGVEQVVLLRVFNGRNINGGHLWQEVRDRGVIQDGLKSPNIGNGVGMGEVRSIPYVAYDYISGKNLSDLLVAASTTQQPMPTDHALLIAERIALALSMAHETRFGNERILHGFVVPHLIMVSSEGETRLLGFEVAPGLTRLAGGGAFSTSVTRYLAPEALSAGQAEKVDDVFSLGVILFELLTCQPLPPPTAEGYGPIVERAQVASEGAPIPPQIAGLIARSLAPRSQRIADAVTWHKELSRLIVDNQFNATTFNLAFFMHNLFRDEIERESEEIEAEKTLEIPQTAVAGATQRITPETVAAATAAASSAKATTTTPPPPAALPEVELDGDLGDDGEEKSKKGLWIGLAAAAALIALAAVAWLFLNRSPAGETVAEVQPETALTSQLPDPALEEPVVEEPEEATPTAEEIQAQLTEMIDSRSQEMEAKLKAQYDDRIASLQTQLQETQEEAAERQRLLEEEQQKEAERLAEEARLEAERLAAEEAAAKQAEEERQAAERAAAEKKAQEEAAAKEAAAKAPPKVRLGELVRPGAGVTPPQVLRMPEPRYPAVARRLNKEATVEVRLLVDETGRVSEAETTGEKVGFGFEQAALDAARRARYEPATKHGVRVKMWTTLKVRFKP